MEAKHYILLAFIFSIVLITGCAQEEQVKEGRSFENAIVIQADNEDEGIAQEYEYINSHACLGKGGIEGVEMQELQGHKDQMFDLLHIICGNGEKEVYYFQIDSFFGKG